MVVLGDGAGRCHHRSMHPLSRLVGRPDLVTRAALEAYHWYLDELEDVVWKSHHLRIAPEIDC